MSFLSTLKTFASLDGLKRAIVPVIALLAGILFFTLSLSNPWWWIAVLPCIAIVLLGVYDATQTNYSITRNFPVGARMRWLFYDLRPYLRAYIVEDDLEGMPFSVEARGLVAARANDTTDAHPFGTELDTAADKYYWFTHSISPVEAPDKSPRISIGGPQCTQPYCASIFNISAMSFGALSAHAIEALNKGAKLGGFYHDTGEGGISPYHLKHGGDLVWEIGSGYFGCRDDDGHFDPDLFAECARRQQVKMIEIKLSQGAKPGHGGLLPGAKVTPEIARVRKVPAGEDCLSPRGHSAFSTPVEMLEFVARLRDLSGGKPIGIKLCVGQVDEVLAIMKAMLKTNILLDFIVVDGGEGGTGAAPLELSNHVGMPLSEGLVVVRNALVGTGLRDRIRIGASGKVYAASGLAKNFAIGADWCNAARAFMFSIGCIQAQRCHLGTCPTGVTTNDPGRERGLVVDDQSEHAARFHKKTLEALADMIAAVGLQNPDKLQPHHLMHRIGSTDSKAFDRIYRFLPANALLDAPQETAYAEWWEAADADSFEPKIDLTALRSRAPKVKEKNTIATSG